MSASSILLADAVALLIQRVEGARALSLPEMGLLARLQIAGEAEQLSSNLEQVTSARSHLSDYRAVAFLGYLCDLDFDLDSSVVRRALHWMVGRDPTIDGEIAGFVVDGVALLGIGLAARKCDPEHEIGVGAWLERLREIALPLDGIEGWERSLIAAAGAVASTDPTPWLEAVSSSEVRVALFAKGVLDALENPTEIEQVDVLQRIREELDSSASPAQAALRITAYRWINRHAESPVPGRVSVDELVSLLEATKSGLRLWTWENTARTRGGEPRKWHVDHEYHVQNLLYLVLAPLFPDLDDEETLPSVGQKQPRADFLLPSLDIVVEVKFLRARDRPQKVIDEIAADLSLYHAARPDLKGVVAYIWDDSARVEEHERLKAGLTRLSGLLAAVVVSWPGKMSPGRG